MRTKNTVSLIGVAGKDAELKIVNGVPYARFSIATSTGGYQKQDGTQVPEKTQWHSIVVWRNLAEVVGKWVKKGMKVAVDGMLTYGEYTNSQGQKIYTTDILVSDIVLMSAPQEQQTTQQTQQPMQNAPQQQHLYRHNSRYSHRANLKELIMQSTNNSRRRTHNSQCNKICINSRHRSKRLT